MCGDGKKHPVTFISRDTQSDSNRVAQVTGDMIQNDKCDIITPASVPDNVLPAADQAEALETPCISVSCPMQTFYTSRGKDPAKDVFNWTYNFFFSLEDQTRSFAAMWDTLATNKVIGVMFPNDADGNADRLVWPALLQELDYKMIDPGAYQNGSEDYTTQICHVQEGGVRSRRWGHGSAGLRQLLETMHPARISPQDREYPKGPSIRGVGGSGRADRLWHDR